MPAPLENEKNDPFISCCIPNCREALESPVDIFCAAHTAAVPVEITNALEIELKQPGDVHLRRWRELIDQARQAVATTNTTGASRGFLVGEIAAATPADLPPLLRGDLRRVDFEIACEPAGALLEMKNRPVQGQGRYIPLVDACRMMKITYGAGWKMVLTGQLRSRQATSGRNRWFVLRRDVVRAAAAGTT